MQNFTEVQHIVTELQRRMGGKSPKVCIVLGTGLGGIANALEDSLVINYQDLPGFPLSTVASHEGRFLLGQLRDQANNAVSVILQQGRCHLYEGYSPASVCTGVPICGCRAWTEESWPREFAAIQIGRAHV